MNYKERLEANKFLIIPPSLGVFSGIIGFIIHMKNSYTNGIPKMSNDYIGVWFASYSIIIALLSIYIILRPGRFSPILSNKSLWYLILFAILSNISGEKFELNWPKGLIIFISYIDANESVGLWTLPWVVYTSLAIIYARVQLRKEKLLQYERIQDNEANVEPERKYCLCVAKGVGACIGWILLLIAAIFLVLSTFQVIHESTFLR